mgnify:CR=1 FL=1
MSALSACVTVQQQCGIETILHYACRDRNLLGMQSDLLGAHSMGIRNVLLVTGDPPQVGDYPDATAVFDVDSIGLTNVVSRLNRGFDIGGQRIGRFGFEQEGRLVRHAKKSYGYEDEILMAAWIGADREDAT